MIVLKYLISLLLVCFLLNGIISCDSPHEKFISDTQTELDSISEWIEKSKEDSYSIEKRKNFLKKAFRLNKLVKNDSLQRDQFINMPEAAYYINDPIFFKKFSDQIFEIFKKKGRYFRASQDALPLCFKLFEFRKNG